MVRDRLYGGLGLLLALGLVAGLSSRLAPPIGIALAAPNLAGTPVDQLAAAAGAIEGALAPGGVGLTFEAIQRNTLYAKPAGPQIEVRDQADPTRVVAVVDEFYVNAIVSRGAVTGDAFWMYMRAGPAKDEPADFDRARPLFSVIERDGALWRNDGDGWYPTDQSPGTGMDPVSARKLPQLLRSLATPDSVQPTLLDGRLLVGLHGTAQPDDYPGVLAADGRDFTDPAIDVTFWLDDAGRLVRLEARGRNLDQTTYDLVSDTVVTFGYGATGDPPEPAPTMPPQQLPTSEPEAVEVQP